MTTALYKHTIIIWSETAYTTLSNDPSGHWINDPVAILVQESINGSALMSHFNSEFVEEPKGDIDFPDTDFFNELEDDAQLELPLGGNHGQE